MKDKVKSIYEIKALISMFFAGEIIVYSVIAYFIGIDSIKISMIFQMWLLSYVIVLLQYVFFNNDKVTEIPIYIRIIAHYIILLSIFILSSKVFNWISLYSVEDTVTFGAIFTIMYILIFISLSTYYKITGEKFNNKLKQYKNKIK